MKRDGPRSLSRMGFFFDAMDNVLGHKPATQLPVVVDSGNYLDDQQ